MRLHNRRKGFTLVELSLVLVIIGLLVGGILVGKDLIAGAATRAQISQIDKYQAAVNTFCMKYGYLPGDIKNADAVAFGFAGRGTLKGQGDGNGVVEGGADSFVSIFTISGETALLWRDLGDAQLIEGQFPADVYNYGTATSCSSAIKGSKIKDHFPVAAIGNESYVYAWSGGWEAGNGTPNQVSYFAVSRVVNPCAMAFDVVFTPNQAYSIDSKLDDGLPQSGKVQAIYPHINGTDYQSGRLSIWSAGGATSANNGQTKAGACNGATNCGPVTATAAPALATDPQTDYGLGRLDCFDNRNVSNAAMQYSTQFMGGNNQACALSFVYSKQ